MPKALLSVSEKRGIVELAQALVERGWKILSTGGTGYLLREAGVPVTGVAEYTGFPELLGGRVKTLHPAIFAGLLARPALDGDMEQLTRHQLAPIGLVAVNLYPFRETVARPGTTLLEALEQIDVGGPSMLRAAAKNHAAVWPVCDPDDYPRLLEVLDSGAGEADLRRELAAKVFRHTAAYDAAIAGYVGGETAAVGVGEELPETRLVSLVRVRGLRYGENPDQRAAFYREASSPPRGIPALRQLHGKELSYNNLLDVDGALRAIAPFVDGERPACVIVKHTTPCGISVSRSAVEAFRNARACDPMSAFGSTVAFSQPVSEAAAEAVSELFVECIVAPGYAAAASRVLQAKKNLRILEPQGDGGLSARYGDLLFDYETRGIWGGVLLQSAAAPVRPEELAGMADTSVAAGREPTPEEWTDIGFAWAAVQAVKSNAIVLTHGTATTGIGAGQMSRVDAVQLAVRKACDAGHEVKGAILASDAFFPFRDGVDVAAEAGVRVIVQPGGSIRDEEVVAAAVQHGLTMVMTGRRLFRH